MEPVALLFTIVVWTALGYLGTGLLFSVLAYADVLTHNSNPLRSVFLGVLGGPYTLMGGVVALACTLVCSPRIRARVWEHGIIFPRSDKAHAVLRELHDFN